MGGVLRQQKKVKDRNDAATATVTVATTTDAVDDASTKDDYVTVKEVASAIIVTASNSPSTEDFKYQKIYGTKMIKYSDKKI